MISPDMSAHRSFHLPKRLDDKLQKTLRQWQEQEGVTRFWNQDATLWTAQGEDRWLGWLTSPDQQQKKLGEYKAFQQWVKEKKFEHVLVMGMGGSSLAPEVFARTFGAQAGWPNLTILDSTNPSQVRTIEQGLNLDRTLFIVASKSGSTLEPNLFQDYFFDRLVHHLGTREKAAGQFVAITDPGSNLQKAAERDGYHQVFLGVPSIGGRYSALSPFGLVPLAAMGVDIEKFLVRTSEMTKACHSPVADNPGVWLGSLIGSAAREKCDKLTLLMAPGVASLGAWLEQLVAESLGKQGHAVIPIDGELTSDLAVYDNDRLFVSVGLRSEVNAVHEDQVRALERAGLPVVRLELQDVYDLGREMFRWEVATAVAGSVMGLNPFDQPDVEASKIATRKLTESFEQTEHLPAETPRLTEGALQIFTNDANWSEIQADTIQGVLKRHLARLQSEDYFALLAYIEMNKTHISSLQKWRESILSHYKVATCVQFGPRFLHSTGQAYKGGSNLGVYLQVTSTPSHDLAIPGRKATFGVVEAAQAQGDFEVMAQRGRRVLHLHITSQLEDELTRIGQWLVDL